MSKSENCINTCHSERSEESFLRPFTAFRVTNSVYLLCIITKNNKFTHL